MMMQESVLEKSVDNHPKLKIEISIWTKIGCLVVLFNTSEKERFLACRHLPSPEACGIHARVESGCWPSIVRSSTESRVKR